MSEPCKRSSRRTFLAGAAAGVIAGGAAGWTLNHLTGKAPTQANSPVASPAPAAPRPLAIPGPYPGRVIEVNHPGVLGTAKKNGYTERNREAVKAMLARGMKDLTSSDDAVGAWRHFFQSGDRVGIKVVPVGKPDSISSYEVVLEVIDALVTAGVRKNDILLFERYKKELMGCGATTRFCPTAFAGSAVRFPTTIFNWRSTGKLRARPPRTTLPGMTPMCIGN
jgi:hypothetical protein